MEAEIQVQGAGVSPRCKCPRQQLGQVNPGPYSGSLKAKVSLHFLLAPRRERGDPTVQVFKFLAGFWGCRLSRRVFGNSREGNRRKAPRSSSSPMPGLRAKRQVRPGSVATPEVLIERQRLLTQHHALLLHTSILKPYFDLLVAEVQPVGQFLAFLPVDEFVEEEFILQLRNLLFSVGFPLLAGSPRGRPPLQACNTAPSLVSTAHSLLSAHPPTAPSPTHFTLRPTSHPGPNWPGEHGNCLPSGSEGRRQEVTPAACTVTFKLREPLTSSLKPAAQGVPSSRAAEPRAARPRPA